MTPIKIEESDPERVREIKEKVIAARAEAVALVESGGSFDRMIEEHRNIINDNAKIWRECEQELRALIEKGDTEGAEQYRSTMGVALQQMGISTLDMIPITEQEKADIIEQRRQSHRHRLTLKESMEENRK